MQQKPDMLRDWKTNFNIAASLLMMHQRALVVPFRRFWGRQALGFPCFFAFVLLFFWAGLSGDPFLWLWFCIWLPCQLLRRIQAWKYRDRIHSEFDGVSAFGKNAALSKLFIEPLICGVIGYYSLTYYQEQGWPVFGFPYFMLAGVFSIPFIEALKRTIWERQIQAAVDARIQNENLVSDFRNRFEGR